MKSILKHAAIILVLSFAAPVVAGPLEDGKAAYDKGDYATALRLLRPLANQGNADAQINLGMKYLSGKGVEQNDAEAIRWVRLAADQGNADAQLHLGR
jgi:TPR repeat protein